MLSDVEIWRELRKGGIVIYPFKPNNMVEDQINDEFRSNIDGGSIYVTASEVGWHFAKSGVNNAGERLTLTNIADKEQLTIPANEWVILCTKEIIYLNSMLSGTCHAKVSLALKGLDHIAAPLKPGSGSRLLLVFFNHTSEDLKIDVGSQIAVVTFHRLNTRPSVKFDSETSRKTLMNNLGYNIAVFDEGLSEYFTYLRPYTKEKAKELMEEDIKTHREQIKRNKNKYGYKFTGKRISFNERVLTRVLIAIAALAIFILSFYPSLPSWAVEAMRYLGAVVLGGIALAAFSSTMDFRKNDD